MSGPRFSSRVKLHSLTVLLSVPLWTQAVGGQPLDFRGLQGLDTTHYHRLDSQVIDHTYHVFVRLPESYEESKRYPAIYLLDGGTSYPLLAGFYRYLNLGREIPDLIIVGISYGSDDRGKGNMRSRDFTARAASRSNWGGAENFQRVLRQELLPIVEGEYSGDPNRRIIFGQSLGGQFVLHSALTAPDLFWGHIASNPALHRNLDFFLNTTPVQPKKGRPRLFVASGSDDDARFRKPALDWMRHWDAQTQRPWDLKTVSLPGQSHFSAAPGAFRQGLRWLLGSDE